MACCTSAMRCDAMLTKMHKERGEDPPCFVDGDGMANAPMNGLGKESKDKSLRWVCLAYHLICPLLGYRLVVY